MNNNPGPKKKSATITLVLLMVGLLPIALFIALVSAHENLLWWLGSGLFFVICILCNLLGGFGCVRNVKSGEVRIALGLLLAFCFLFLSWVVVVFEIGTHIGPI